MTDFRKLFKRENFDKLKSFDECGEWPDVQAAQIAQSILNEALDKAIKVYASKSQGWQWTESRCDMDTHEGLLIEDRQIEKCSHKNYRPTFPYSDKLLYCPDCEKQLIPTGFKVKDD